MDKEMDDQIEQQPNTTTNILSFLGGLLVGGLVGAVAMLLVAPQSGEKTRGKIMQKGADLRDQANDSMHDVMVQTRHKARQIRRNVTHKADALQQRGQDVLDEQKERLSDFAEAGKKAIQAL